MKTPVLKKAADKYAKLWQSLSSGQQLYGANFSCPDMKSPTTPVNVNALRPGDFAYIGALGDSLTVSVNTLFVTYSMRKHVCLLRSLILIQAGNGAGAKNVVEVAVEYRGLVFAAGGDGNISYQTTTPSMI